MPLPLFLALFFEQLFDGLEALVGHGDRQHVLLDLPGAADVAENAAAARGAEVLRLELLVEPAELARAGHVPPHAAEAPRLALGEVWVRVGAEGGRVPALGRVGADEDAAGREVREVALLVGVRGGVVEVVERARDRGRSGAALGDERRRQRTGA